MQELGNFEEKKPLQPKDQDVPSAVPEVNSNDSPKLGEVTEAPVEAQRVILERQISATPPLPPKNAQIIAPPAPLRGITSVVPLPVPEMPAPPRPDSIIRETCENDSETTPDKSTDRIFCVQDNSPPISKRWNVLRMPKRTYSVKGIEEDDPVGKFTAFIWWFFFILARVLSLAVFYEFYSPWLLGTVGCHYILMLIFLFYHAKDYDITTFIVNLWLGLVYIISIIEYRVKFKYADKWLIVYYVFVILQNIFMTVTWFVLKEWQNFWYTYIFNAIFISTGLCIISTCVYQVLLKPGKRRIYAS